MGGTKKQAELRLFLPVDEATLKRSIDHFHRMQREEDSLRAATAKRVQASREGLANYVKNLKSESVVSAEAAREVNEHAKALDKAGQAAKKAATSQDFYNKAVRSQYGSQRALLTGGASGGMASAAGGRASTTLSALASALPGGAGGIARQIGDFVRLQEEISRTGVAANAAGGSFNQLGTGMSGLMGAALPLSAAVFGMGIAFAALQQKLNEAQAELEQTNDLQVRYFQLLATGTADQIQAELTAKQIERDAYKDANEEIDKTVAAMSLFEKGILTLKGVFNTGLVEIYEKNDKAADNLEKEIDNLTKALNSDEVKARTAAEAAKKQAQETEKLTRASKEVTQAQERQTEAAQKAAQAQQQLANLYQGIVEHGRQAAQNLAKTEDQRLKDILALNQRYAQQERDELRQRGRQQAAEKRRAAYDEKRAEIEGRLTASKLAADRDFAGLADLRDQQVADDALKALDDAFNAQEKTIAEREAAEDKSIQYARDRASIEQRVNEARISAAQTELDYMRQVVAEFAKLRTGFGDPRYYNEAQIRSVYGAAAGAAGAAPLDPSKVRLQVAKRAGGGWLGAGQMSTYNEIPGQREAFGGQMLPAGMGMIWPARGGNVTNHNGGNTNIFNITGNNPEQIWRQIERKLDERDRRTFSG